MGYGTDKRDRGWWKKLVGFLSFKMMTDEELIWKLWGEGFYAPDDNIADMAE